MKEISDTLSHAIEMVQVVFNNDQMSFGSRLHVCISLSSFIRKGIVLHSDPFIVVYFAYISLVLPITIKSALILVLQ